MRYDFAQMDVFAEEVLRGNGLAVVFVDRFPEDAVMLDLAREFKQFETIFLTGYEKDHVTARIFTMEGELPFAGHPVLGAVAALHKRHLPDAARMEITVSLRDKEVPVVSVRAGNGFDVEMRQGPPAFLGGVPAEEVPWYAQSHNMDPTDLDATLPMEVVSTGLPYLLIPVTGGLEKARIIVRDLAEWLQGLGASYAYLFDTNTLKARTWDNLGLVEDSATGSAAGPVCAYLVRHGRVQPGETITIHQGEYAHRPSVLHAVQRDGEIFVSGHVVPFAEGTFTLA